jgi:hypothetical protein
MKRGSVTKKNQSLEIVGGSLSSDGALETLHGISIYWLFDILEQERTQIALYTDLRITLPMNDPTSY